MVQVSFLLLSQLLVIKLYKTCHENARNIQQIHYSLPQATPEPSRIHVNRNVYNFQPYSYNETCLQYTRIVFQKFKEVFHSISRKMFKFLFCSHPFNLPAVCKNFIIILRSILIVKIH